MQIAICDDDKSIGLILEEKIKKLLPDGWNGNGKDSASEK